MLLKTYLLLKNLLLYLFSNIKSELIYFILVVSEHQAVTRDFKSANKNATEV